MKFGVHEIIRPLSLDKIVSDRKLWVAGAVKGHVEKVANSVRPENEQDMVKECLQAIKQIKAGNTDYCAIEFFPSKDGTVRMNICYMQTVE